MQINWSEFSKFDYWFAGISGNISITPPIETNSQFYWFFLWLFSLIISSAILIKFATIFLHAQHPLVEKINFWGDNVLWIGILGNFWFLCRQLSVGFLGARLWLWFLLIWFLVLVGFIIRYFLVTFQLEYLYYLKHYRSDLHSKN